MEKIKLSRVEIKLQLVEKSSDLLQDNVIFSKQFFNTFRPLILTLCPTECDLMQKIHILQVSLFYFSSLSIVITIEDESLKRKQNIEDFFIKSPCQ